MPFTRRHIKNSTAAIAVLGMAGLLLLLFWYRAEWPAGGQDSWNHYLYARFAWAHPELMADQWGKPFFTIIAMPFARAGIAGIYVLNLACVLATGWFVYLTARKLNMKLPWLSALFFLFQPVVFGNTISGLTEPLNALVLTVLLYLLASQRFWPAAILASFLPFFRSEGFILLVAVGLYFGIRRRWKLMLWLLCGSLVVGLTGALISGDPTWIFSHNPYIKAETEGRFDPGQGDFFHYLHAQRQISGTTVTVLVVAAMLLLLAHTVYLLRRKTPEEKSRFCYWLISPMFLAFFLAHSWLWYSGSFGSHGLLRVFLIVSPLLALLAQYAADKLLALDIKWLSRAGVALVVILMLIQAYQGSNTPWPWKKEPSVAAFPGEPQIAAALKYIKDKGLQDHVLVHQLPWLNAKLSLDPWAQPEAAKTFYIWSIDKQPGKDWMPDSAVVLWDNYHARRDAPMPLHEMRRLTEYHELAYFPSKSDSIYDVRVFLKVKQR